MVALIFVAAVTVGLVGAIANFTFDTARDRGRLGLVWAAASVAAGVGGCWLVYRALERGSLAESGAPAAEFLGLVVVLFLPAACAALVTLVVRLLPTTRPPLWTTHWKVRTTRADGREVLCELGVLGEDITIAPGGPGLPLLRIPGARIEEVTADLEAIRLAWADDDGTRNERLFFPVGDVRSRQQRLRRAEAIAARLRASAVPASLPAARALRR